MTRHWGRTAGLLVGTILVVAGCVGPAPSTDAYKGKAHLSAEAAISSLQTAKLAVDTSAKGNLLDSYLEVVLSSAEDDFGSVQQQFDSIQPPNSKAADAMRNRLDILLTQGSSTLSDVRIAARRDEQDAMIKSAQNIPPLVAKLDRFAQATQ